MLFDKCYLSFSYCFGSMPNTLSSMNSIKLGPITSKCGSYIVL